jgi:hypothetical protein
MTRFRTRPPALDVTIAIPGLAPYARTATRLHPRPADVTGAASHVGGPFRWPAGEAWPICTTARWSTPQLPDYEDFAAGIVREPEPWIHGPNPMVGLVQLAAADVPDLWCPPDADLLQVFWCPYLHQLESGIGPTVTLRWRRAADVTTVLTTPPAADVEDDDFVPRPCAVYPEQVVEYPGDLPPELEGLLYAPDRPKDHTFAISYARTLSAAPGWKVGGWPTWTQEPDPAPCPGCAAPMTLLLTVDSSEFDGGTAPGGRSTTSPTRPGSWSAAGAACAYSFARRARITRTT